MIPFLIALVSSYLVGSIPTGYLLVKRWQQVDVRTVGSGNVGATNVMRVAGLGAGAVVFAVDAAKGLLAVLVIAPWLIEPATPAARLACGLAAVLGHNVPIFLNFRGGKGVATTLGALLGASPLVAASCLGVWAVTFGLWRYVSVGSLAAAVTIPVAQLVNRRPLPEVGIGAVLALLIIVRHLGNIRRLREGREHRLGRLRPSGGPQLPRS
jgi:glycerol-3-phosphate acyltransferase PlsY